MNCFRSVYRLDTRPLNHTTRQFLEFGPREASLQHAESFCHLDRRLHADPGWGGATRVGRTAPDPAVEPAGNAAPPPPPPNNGVVPPAAPGVLDTPDGWHLTVSAVAETQLPVAPLTTSLASREYLVGGTFAGSITGSGKTELGLDTATDPG